MEEIISANDANGELSADESKPDRGKIAGAGKHIAAARIRLNELDQRVGDRLMSRIANLVRMGGDVAELIDPAKEYALRIPSWFLGDSDETWLNRRHDDPDAILPAIMRRNDQGKNVILKNLDAFERPAKDAMLDAGRDIADALGDAALRRELGECVQRLELVSKRVELVIEGQMDDRASLIEGPWRQVKAALASGDSDHVAKRLEEAVPILNVGTVQIERATERLLDDFSDIPNGNLAIRAKLIVDPDLIFRTNDAFDKIQDCVEYLRRAYTLLAVADLAEGQPESAKVALEPLRDFLIESAEKIKTFTDLHPEIDFSHEWFEEPEQYMESLEGTVASLTPGEADGYLIELEGSKLLGAANDD